MWSFSMQQPSHAKCKIHVVELSWNIHMGKAGMFLLSCFFLQAYHLHYKLRVFFWIPCQRHQAQYRNWWWVALSCFVDVFAIISGTWRPINGRPAKNNHNHKRNQTSSEVAKINMERHAFPRRIIATTIIISREKHPDDSENRKCLNKSMIPRRTRASTCVSGTSVMTFILVTHHHHHHRHYHQHLTKD